MVQFQGMYINYIKVVIRQALGACFYFFRKIHPQSMIFTTPVMEFCLQVPVIFYVNWGMHGNESSYQDSLLLHTYCSFSYPAYDNMNVEITAYLFSVL
jgi:hypothetical protein